ncbi:hypothetical protein XFF6166_80068 [Xanthomonas citri pv. fuscans]|nr:hypothetical protein XFF6166_80068 [Xanthomonas citri pv. fuscans]SOO03185.1 hypothetical protein XFF7767_150067 [Xanthomonas citri pv. fuscans]
MRLPENAGASLEARIIGMRHAPALRKREAVSSMLSRRAGLAPCVSARRGRHGHSGLRAAPDACICSRACAACRIALIMRCVLWASGQPDLSCGPVPPAGLQP